MEYHLVTSTTTDNFNRSVQYWLDLGWEPLGGVAVSQVGSYTTYAQALVKRYDRDTTAS